MNVISCDIVRSALCGHWFIHPGVCVIRLSGVNTWIVCNMRIMYTNYYRDKHSTIIYLRAFIERSNVQQAPTQPQTPTQPQAPTQDHPRQRAHGQPHTGVSQRHTFGTKISLDTMLCSIITLANLNHKITRNLIWKQST